MPAMFIPAMLTRKTTSLTCLGVSGSTALILTIAATAHSPHSMTPTVTAGFCRRSPAVCPGASTPPARRSRRRANWPARFGAPRLPTESTKSASGSATRTGPTGTQRTWWRIKTGQSCRRERHVAMAISHVRHVTTYKKKTAGFPRPCSCMTLRSLLLHRYVRNARGPVAQCSARVAAGEVRNICGKVTGLCVVLTGDEDGISIDGGSSVVAPAWTHWIDLWEVRRKAVIRTGARGGNMHIACSSQGIKRGIACAGIVVLTEHGEGNHAASAGGDANGRIGHVIVCERDDALRHHAGIRLGERALGLQHKEGCSRLVLSIHRNGRIQRRPQLAVGVRNLLHARIIAGQLGFCLRERPRRRGDQQPPATEPQRSHDGAIGKALALGEVAGLLRRIRGYGIELCGYVVNRQGNGRRCVVDGLRVGQLPHHKLVGCAQEDSHRTQQEFSAAVVGPEVGSRRDGGKHR